MTSTIVCRGASCQPQKTISNRVLDLRALAALKRRVLAHELDRQHAQQYAQPQQPVLHPPPPAPLQAAQPPLPSAARPMAAATMAAQLPPLLQVRALPPPPAAPPPAQPPPQPLAHLQGPHAAAPANVATPHRGAAQARLWKVGALQRLLQPQVPSEHGRYLYFDSHWLGAGKSCTPQHKRFYDVMPPVGHALWRESKGGGVTFPPPTEQGVHCCRHCG